jgi:hypothetical protein
MRLGHKRDAYGGRWKHQADEKGVDDQHTEIAGPAHAAADGLSAAWTEHLPRRHQREDGAESAQPEPWLASEYGISHGRQSLVLTRAYNLFNYSFE